jgi:hypothetical protein
MLNIRSGSRLLGVLALLGPGTVFAHDVFVSADGTPMGPGTMDRPYNLATALSGRVGKAGTTFWLRGGNYAIGHIDTKIEGAPRRPITFRQWPGERARVDGSVTFFDSAGYVILRDFELFSSDTNRFSRQTNVGFKPTDIKSVPGISAYVPNMSFINLVVHDQTRHGFYLSHECSNTLVYGCIVYNNGWWAPDNGEGHGLYVQGHKGSREISDNLVFNNSGVGFHIYDNTPGPRGFLGGIILDGNVGFNSGCIQNVRCYRDWIIGVDAPAVSADRIIVRNNMGYDLPTSAGRNQVEIGREGINGSVALLNNYFPQGLAMKNWFIAAVSGNVIGTRARNHVVDLDQTRIPLTAVWNKNTYCTPRVADDFKYTAGSLSSLDWQMATGFDQDSTCRVGVMSGTKVFIRPNKYEPGRANIVVYNWDGQSNVVVNARLPLAPGAPYEVRNAADLLAPPVLSGVYTGQSLNVPMTGLTVASPIGPMLTSPPTGPTFNVFVLLPLKAKQEGKLTKGEMERPRGTNTSDLMPQIRSSLSPGNL